VAAETRLWEELARWVRVSQAAISKIERRGDMQLSTLRKADLTQLLLAGIPDNESDLPSGETSRSPLSLFDGHAKGSLLPFLGVTSISLQQLP
jgi:hypothetical protein